MHDFSREVVREVETKRSPVTVRLLDTTSRGRTLAGSFGGQLLARSLSSGGFTGSLLGTGHSDEFSPAGSVEGGAEIITCA